MRARWTPVILLLSIALSGSSASSQTPGQWRVDFTQPQDFILKRVSSFDRSGGNADFRPIAPGQTLEVMDENGPGLLTHIWFTLASREMYHLKKLVLRMYWDGEAAPS